MQGKKKKGCLGCLGFLVLLFIIAGIFGSSDSKTEKSTDGSTVKTEQSSKSTAEKEKKNEIVMQVEGVGKIKGAVSSKVDIAVAGVDSKKTIAANQFSKATAEGKYIIVNIVVKNNQKDAVTIDSTSFKLIDDQKREFSHDVNAETQLELANGGNVKSFLSKLNPGMTRTFHIAFDVPEDVQGLKLEARGGMTGDKILLPLQVIPAK